MIYLKPLQAIVAILALGYMTPCLAKDKAPPVKKERPMFAARDGGEFALESNLVDQIFATTVAKQEAGGPKSASIRPGFAILVPQRLELRNQYFSTDYASQWGAIPVASLGFARELSQVGVWKFDLGGSVGFSQKQGSVNTRASSGLEVNDSVTLQWIPVDLSSTATYALSVAPWLQPRIHAGLGGNWFYQTGNLDGLEQSAMLATLNVGPGLRLLASKETGAAVTWGSIFKTSLAAESGLRGWQHQLTAEINL